MTTTFATLEELYEGFEEASTHSWPIVDAHNDCYVVSCTEAGDVFAQGLPFADDDGSNYNANLHDVDQFETSQYPFRALVPAADAEARTAAIRDRLAYVDEETVGFVLAAGLLALLDGEDEDEAIRRAHADLAEAESEGR